MAIRTFEKDSDNLETSDLEIIIEEAFRLLAEQTENYVDRKEQIGMANQLMLALYESQSIVRGRHREVNLLPILLLLSPVLPRGHVLLSTETQSLQLQLVEKDLPLARRVLNLFFRVFFMSWLWNYLCRLRCEETSNQGKFTDIISEKN